MTAQSEIMGLNNVAIRATAKPGERAWPGDFKIMQLSTSKIEAGVETRKEQRRIRQVGNSTAGQVASHTIRKKRTEGCGELGFTESVEEHVLLRLLSGSVFSPHNPLHRVESLIERE